MNGVKRKSLRELLEPASPYPSTSVVEATGISPAERRAADERWWGEHKRQESGEVEVSFDPSLFEWVRPDFLFEGTVSTIRFYEKGIAVTIGEKDAALGARDLLGAKVEVGFAPSAIAIRQSDGVGSYTLTHHKQSKRYGIIRSPKLLRLAERRGFKLGTILEARWDPKHRMLVGIKPKEAQGRRAG